MILSVSDSMKPDEIPSSEFSVIRFKQLCFFLVKDACESIGVLPSIQVQIEELTQDEFNIMRGISVETKDTELFEIKGGKGNSAVANGGGGSRKKRKSAGGNNSKGGTASSTTKARKKHKRILGISKQGYDQIFVGMHHSMECISFVKLEARTT